MSAQPPSVGALVISLDSRLHWGVRDHTALRTLAPKGARNAIKRLLETFTACTPAAISFLLPQSQHEKEAMNLVKQLQHAHVRPNAHAQQVGEREASDAAYSVPSLVGRIWETLRHELAAHTFSRFYCDEPSATLAGFCADLNPTHQIEVKGRSFGSIVLPRNQSGPEYVAVLLGAGINAYRRNTPSRFWRGEDGEREGGINTCLSVGRGNSFRWKTVGDRITAAREYFNAQLIDAFGIRRKRLSIVPCILSSARFDYRREKRHCFRHIFEYAYVVQHIDRRQSRLCNRKGL